MMMRARQLAAYLLAASFAALIWLGATSWRWSSDDLHAGFLPAGATAALAIVCAFLPYHLLLRLAPRRRDDPDGLLLWWLIVAPPLAITCFAAVTVGLPRVLFGAEPVADLSLGWLEELARFELILATVYGYTGHLLLKLPSAAARPAPA